MSDFTRTKYIIYTILGVVVLGVVGVMLYRFLAPVAPQLPVEQPGVTGRPVGAPGTTPGGGTPPTTGQNPPENIPPPEEQKLVQLTDFAVIGPSLDKEEKKILFYKKDGGDLFAVGFRGGEQEKVAHVTIVGLIEALWSRARDRAAVFYLGDESRKAFIHLGTTSIAVLPQDIASFSWSPDGRSLAYLLQKDGLVNLTIADASGKNPKTVFTTPIADAQISWISPDKIAFQTAASGLAEGFIFTFSRSAGAFTRILGPVFGLDTLWSPDGARILASQTRRGGKNLTTALYDPAKKKVLRLESSTLIEKCSWAGAKELFCAVPRAIPAETILPDEYLSGEFNSSDRIIRIEAETGEATTIIDEGNFDMSDLIATKDKNFLFFVNRKDGTLWSVRLK